MSPYSLLATHAAAGAALLLAVLPLPVAVAGLAQANPASLDLALADEEGIDGCDSAPQGLGLVQYNKAARHNKGAAHQVAPVPPASGLFQEPETPDTSVLPVSWLHVPKCGSSLLNALVRIPGACHDLPDDVVINDETMGPDNIAGFWLRYPQQVYCPEIATTGGHNGVGSLAHFQEIYAGLGVTVLRQPEQRVLSAFHDMCHSWPLAADNPLPTDPRVFAIQEQGCTVKMLTRSGTSHFVNDVPHNGNGIGPHWGGPCGAGPPPTPAEVKEAKRRLHGFRFVGVQEEWELSMCLFHATFGGTCHPGEFVNTRHVNDEKPLYDEAESLGNWTDVYDGELYKEAQKIFKTRFQALGLSVETCQTCFKQANVTYP